MDSGGATVAISNVGTGSVTAVRACKVVDPRGRTWVVAVRWLPWRLRWRGPRRSRKDGPPSWANWLDLGDLFAGIDEGFGWLLLAIGAVAALLAAIFWVVPLFSFIVEFVLGLIAVLVVFALRLVFRQPWLVDAATRDGRPEMEFVWAVRGLKRAEQTLDEVAVQLQAGTATPIVTTGKLVASRTPESTTQ